MAEVQSLAEKSTAATEVARLRLETPSRIGIPRRASARSSSSGAEPVALGAEGEDRPLRQHAAAQVLAAGSIATSGRSLLGSASTAATGSA